MTFKTFLLGLTAAAAVFSAAIIGVPSTSDRAERSGQVTIRSD